MNKYKQLSDEELIAALRAGNQEIIDFLLDKYKNLVRKKADPMFLLGGDREDLIQEGMIGLYGAIREYDPTLGGSFYSFAELCITRRMYTAIQNANRLKNQPLNFYISLNGYAQGETLSEEQRMERDIIGSLISASDPNPEDMLIDKENVERIEKAIVESLSPLEKKVLDLFRIGMDYTEIAALLGRSDKSIDNALHRIKSKLRKALFLG